MFEMISHFLGRNRIITSALLFTVLFILAHPTPFSIIIGMPFLIAGECIRIWSSGHIKKNDELAVSGPYSFTRNPLYLGNFLLGLGFSLMGWNIILMIIFFVSFYLIYSSTILKEEKKMLGMFGEEFVRYKNNVPRFFPRFTASRSQGEFDWDLVKRHREYNTWIGIFGGIILMLLKMIYG